MYIVFNVKSKEINIMNKANAISWCVENINTWPKYGKGIVSAPVKWSWVDHTSSNGYRDMILINKTYQECIDESEWIDAVMKPHSDSESVF